MATSVVHLCVHARQSGALRLDAGGALRAVLVCDDCGAITRELPAQTADARRQMQCRPLDRQAAA